MRTIMKFYALLAAMCLLVAPAFCANEVKAAPSLPDRTEFFLKSGMGCLESVSDAYPCFTGGLGFRIPKLVYGMDLIAGLDSVAYADTTRLQAGSWMKTALVYRPFKIQYLKNSYVGLGLSAGLVRKSYWTPMTPAKKEAIKKDLSERKANPNSKPVDPKWEAAPEDRYYWETATNGGMYGEALLGYEWYPTFFRNVNSLSGSRTESLVPLRLFIELAARYAVVPVKGSAISEGPYFQLDFGVGF